MLKTYKYINYSPTYKVLLSWHIFKTNSTWFFTYFAFLFESYFTVLWQTIYLYIWHRSHLAILLRNRFVMVSWIRRGYPFIFLDIVLYYIVNLILLFETETIRDLGLYTSWIFYEFFTNHFITLIKRIVSVTI